MAQNVWERSANRDNGCNVALCNSTGNVDNNNAYNGNRCAPIASPSGPARPRTGTCPAACDTRSPSPEGGGACPVPEQGREGRGAAPRGDAPSGPPKPCRMEDAFSFDALSASLARCMRGSGWKRRSAWCWEHRAELCARLEEELMSGSYRPGRTVSFEVAKPKRRTIVATDVVDRVVQRSLNDNVVYPIMSRPWVYDNCACQHGKGTDFARMRLHAWMERAWRAAGPGAAALRCDVSGYYANMAHSVAEARLRRRLPAWASDFAVMVLRSQYGDGERGYSPGSQLVQICGVDYLDPLDHLVKERLRPLGYVRYMDDFILLCRSPAEAAEMREAVASRLGELGLSLHPSKTAVQGIGAPLRFLGFDHLVSPRTGKAWMRVAPESVKQARRDTAALGRLVRAGRLSEAQYRESCRCRRAHMAKGASPSLLDRYDRYCDDVLRGALDDRH